MATTEKKYVIVKDRVEIYLDFIFLLNYYIHRYYIDRKSLCDDQDINNHFKWCFDKACNDFLTEDIDFTNNKSLVDYFYDYYYQQFYVSTIDQESSLKTFEKFWGNIFNIKNRKNKNIINVLIEIYLIFDMSINQEKNILEIV